uniref:Ribosomal protein S13 n=1 Tax=Acavomonas peruviana TaxID=1542312 RepID=V5KVI3_9ALVE|nr:ribosomal protein S13 [Acavomonas peruviana]
MKIKNTIRFSHIINNIGFFESDLLTVSEYVKSLNIKYRTYKGIRFKKKLPVNGQRTHSNRKTSKKLNLFFFRKVAEWSNALIC